MTRNLAAWGPETLVAILWSPVPNISPGKNFIGGVSLIFSENEAMLHPAKSITDMVFHPQAVPAHPQQLGISFGIYSALQEYGSQESASMYRAPHGYSSGSFMTGFNGDTRNALRSTHGAVSVPWTDTTLWQRALSLNMASSAHILFVLNHSQNRTRRSIPSPCNSCTECILYGWNFWRRVIRGSYTWIWKYSCRRRLSGRLLCTYCDLAKYSHAAVTISWCYRTIYSWSVRNTPVLSQSRISSTETNGCPCCGLLGWRRWNYSAVCCWLRSEACTRIISAVSWTVYLINITHYSNVYLKQKECSLWGRTLWDILYSVECSRIVK